MGINLGKFFFRRVDQEADRLSKATDPEIPDMTTLVSGAIEHGIPVAPRMPDDPGTGISAAIAHVLHSTDFQNLARHAEANRHLGR